MHAIITSTTPNFTDAGRQLLTTIHEFPNRSTKVIHIVAGDFGVASDAEDTPVAMLPVPVPTLKRVRTVNRQEGLAMLQHRRALLAQRESGSLVSGDASAQACPLERVGTVNKLEDLAMFEHGKARVPDDNTFAGLAILERLEALSTKEDSGNGSLVLAESQACTLRRVGAINKRAGLDILERRERRKEHLFWGSFFQTFICL